MQGWLQEQLSKLKGLVFVQGFSQLVTVLIGVFERLFHSVRERKQKHKFLNQELQVTNDKLKDSLGKIENSHFKLKVEMESLKLDKKHQQEQWRELELKYEQMRLEKRDQESRLKKALEELD